MKLLTVSIAAYNVEKYIDETLESLCDDRYIDNIEVLIIDDGSKDNTGQIAAKYQEKYPNSVKYIKKPNGGHGSTINKGIELASGKYFRIIDGDDYVDKDGFVAYLNKLNECESDIVITDYCWVDNERNVYPHNHEVFRNTPINFELEFDKTVDSTLFGLSTLTIKTQLLKNSGMKITENCFYVDVEFIVWAIYLANNYIFFNDKVYMYRCISTTQNSVNKGNMLKNVSMQEKVALNLCYIYKEKFSIENADEKKNMVILDRIKMSICATIRTFLLYPKYTDSIKNIKRFDNEINNSSQFIYDYISKDTFIKNIRRNNYSLVPLIRLVYNIYIKVKKK